jgi:hypothetical protein
MNERWLPISGWEGAYSVSDRGRVRSERRIVRQSRNRYGADFDRTVPERILKPGMVRGYERVSLQRDGRTQSLAVHRLVLTAFVGPCPDGMEACHGDADRTNNTLANLRWDTKSANCKERTLQGGSPNARKTHCPQGHPYSPENTRMDGGSRKCKTCRSRRAVERKRRIRLAQKENAA